MVSFLTIISVAATFAQVHAMDLPASLSKNDFQKFDIAKAEIGQLLFYDPILSGNRNISCGTCHNHKFGSSDGLSLGIGEGGDGVGTQRTTGVVPTRIPRRIPRNSPGLWNLGAFEVQVLFHDGRLSVSDIYGNGFKSPAEERLPQGLENILAAQAVFPMTSQFEMAGQTNENEVAGAAHDRIDSVWPILAKRVRTIPQYGSMFVGAFDDISSPSDVTISHIANSIAAFVGLEWISFDSPFDSYLAGNFTALTSDQKSGMKLFFGSAKCSTCHSGSLLTDHKFHALALPSFGPGRTRRFDPIARDVGRMGETDRIEDAYRFRTPALRNVALTGPYGHNGAYSTLAGIVRHHLDPVNAFESWVGSEANLPKANWIEASDFLPLDDARERARLTSKLDIKSQKLGDSDIKSLVAFLQSLTGAKSIEGRLGAPLDVPSGLKVDR